MQATELVAVQTTEVQAAGSKSNRDNAMRLPKNFRHNVAAFAKQLSNRELLENTLTAVEAAASDQANKMDVTEAEILTNELWRRLNEWVKEE